MKAESVLLPLLARLCGMRPIVPQMLQYRRPESESFNSFDADRSDRCRSHSYAIGPGPARGREGLSFAIVPLSTLNRKISHLSIYPSICSTSTSTRSRQCDATLRRRQWQ